MFVKIWVCCDFIATFTKFTKISFFLFFLTTCDQWDILRPLKLVPTAAAILALHGDHLETTMQLLRTPFNHGDLALILIKSMKPIICFQTYPKKSLQLFFFKWPYLWPPATTHALDATAKRPPRYFYETDAALGLRLCSSNFQSPKYMHSSLISDNLCRNMSNL